MSFLSPDKNSLYNLSIFPKNKVYVRTGTHGDGSCFYHSYLRATKLQYKYSNYEDRCVYVKRLRENLAEKVTNESLSKLNGKELRRMLFMTILREETLNGFPPDQFGNLLNKIINLGEILDSVSTSEGNFYFQYLEKINTLGEIKIGKNYEKFKKYIAKWCYDIFRSVGEKVLEHFKAKILHDQVSSIEIEFIARQLECNFLFVSDHNGGKIYPFSANIDPSWPYIVLLWNSESHYEIIGEMRPDKTVARTFTENDELIQTLLGVINS